MKSTRRRKRIRILSKEDKEINENLSAAIGMCISAMSDDFFGMDTDSEMAEHIVEKCEGKISKSTALRAMKGQITGNSKYRTIELISRYAGFVVRIEEGVVKMRILNVNSGITERTRQKRSC